MAKEEPIDLIETTTEKHTVRDSITCARDKHLFIMTSGTEAECKKCHIGFFLPTGAEVKEDHIYMNGELMV